MIDLIDLIDLIFNFLSYKNTNYTMTNNVRVKIFIKII